VLQGGFGMEALTVELALSIALGIGLSAACGFRVFVPFTVMSLAAFTGYLELGQGFEWIGTLPALIAFATATVLEIGAFYIPWVDNLLDAAATPTAVIAGMIATAAVVTDMSPLMTWTLAAIVGGGAAGLVQAATATVRGVSTTTTLGVGNFAVATLELIGSLVTSTLSIVAPFLVIALLLVLALWVARKLRRSQRPVTP
jgi:hypothetical protein